jgi:hypothetical protein
MKVINKNDGGRTVEELEELYGTDDIAEVAELLDDGIED